MKRRLVYDNLYLHILLIHDQEKDVFIADCLEMDIAAQGKTQKGALGNLNDCIKMQLKFAFENNALDTVFRSAPQEEWDMFYKYRLLNARKKFSLHPWHTSKELLSSLLKNPEIAYA